MSFECIPCNFESKYKRALHTHTTSQTHFLNTGEINKVEPKYTCVDCDYNSLWSSHWERHINSLSHKRNTKQTQPKFNECSLCSYKSYNKKNFVYHIKRHKTEQTNLKKILFKAGLKDVDEEIKDVDEEIKTEPIIKDKDVLKNDINKILMYCIENNLDPNKYFNYGYYAKNINDLNIIELNDFLIEIKTVIQ